MNTVLKKREQLILYITIALIVFSITFNFLIMPIVNKYDTLNKEITLYSLKLKKYRSLLKHKSEIESKYAQFSLSAESIIDTNDPLVTSLAALETLAKNTNIKITDIRPEAMQKQANQAIIELRTEGTMENYSKFIYDLENSLLLLKIKRLQLSAKPNTQPLEGAFTIIQNNFTK